MVDLRDVLTLAAITLVLICAAYFDILNDDTDFRCSSFTPKNWIGPYTTLTDRKAWLEWFQNLDIDHDLQLEVRCTDSSVNSYVFHAQVSDVEGTMLTGAKIQIVGCALYPRRKMVLGLYSTYTIKLIMDGPMARYEITSDKLTAYTYHISDSPKIPFYDTNHTRIVAMSLDPMSVAGKTTQDLYPFLAYLTKINYSRYGLESQLLQYRC